MNSFSDQERKIESSKRACDFRVTNCYGRFNTIVWNATGNCERVSDKKLEKLQASFTWSTDF